MEGTLGKMAQWVKMFAAQPDYLGSVPRNHTGKERTNSHNCPFPPHSLCGMHAHTKLYAHKMNKYIKIYKGRGKET